MKYVAINLNSFVYINWIENERYCANKAYSLQIEIDYKIHLYKEGIGKI